MIVDDTPPNLRLLCDMLGDKGYRLRPFSKPLAALESARSDPPDLYLLDVGMPEMNGYELCDALKKDERTQAAPVLFISANKETEGIVEGFRHGAVDYIVKPFQAEEVASRIATHLSLRRFQRTMQERNSQLQTTIRELKETQSQLVHAEKMASLGTLTAGIAHEINNPINFICANAKLLQKRLAQIDSGERVFEAGEAADWREMVDGLMDGSARIAEIVSSLETYARVDEDSMKIFAPRPNIEATARMFRHQIGSGIDFAISIEEPSAPIVANPGKVNQVLANLLSNAISVVAENPPGRACRIALRAGPQTREGRDWYAISVADTGPGVEPDKQERIFEPFFTTKPPGQGLGLGLSIASSIMAQHRGRLELESTPEGATFTALLPIS